ncbi:MAG TPA: DUF5916 domain-containing protein [Gemmatimonadaceae bacterium]|nr:DUF5916 domain-containing protein [Gemmatimonadaceae bacterium]
MRTVVPLALIALLPAAAAAQLASAVATPKNTAASARVSSAIRAQRAPELDGRDVEEVWYGAPVIDQFLEYEPNEGAETRFRTEARVVYDDRYLYILVRMFDPAPDSIVSLLARRDVRVSSEQLKLVIDSYHDRRTAYQFAVNPAGVKRDFYVYNDAIEDASWDAVWDVATAVDSLGWVAEFRIPFSQLRFANKPEHTFGLMIVRDVARTGARISWPLYRRNVQGYVSQSGEINGIRGIPSPRRIEVTPYVVTKNVTEPAGGSYSHAQKMTGGADIKLGLSSNLTLDATVNPDFGQVEADPAVLNLGAFETRFQERRPFFLEGTGIFTFNVHCGDIDSDCTGLFYSRRIGRAPQLSGEYDYVSNVTATTIVGAAKMTGRLSKGLSVGLLNALTEREEGELDETIEPRTNYAVARLQQDLREGQTSIGAMMTAVNRDVDEFSAAFLRREAYTGGLDMRHRFGNRRFELAAYVAGSYVAGSADAIAATQRSSVHSYQRPDDDVAYDPTRTSLGGDAQRVSISKFGGGVTRFQSVYQRFSPGFEINDVGFLTRADEQMFRNWFALQFNTPKAFYRRANWNFNYWQHWSADGMPTNIGVNTNAHVQLKNQWWIHSGVTYSNFVGRSYLDRVSRGGPAVRRSPSVDYWGGIEGDARKAIQPFLWGGYWRGDEGNSHNWWIEPSLSFRASTRFSGAVGFTYLRNTDDAQWKGNFGDAGADTTHYTFAHLNQTTVSLTARVNYTFTPNVSLQIYAQPFVTTGTYSDWRELDDARAERYETRFKPFVATAVGGDSDDPGGFDFGQFRSNTVLRWEYRSGSTLFFVWSQGRDRSVDGAARFQFRDGVEDLFRQHPDNTFLIKASFWFNP